MIRVMKRYGCGLTSVALLVTIALGATARGSAFPGATWATKPPAGVGRLTEDMAANSRAQGAPARRLSVETTVPSRAETAGVT